MAACLKAGGHNHVHARMLQGNRFVHGGRRPNQHDSSAAELIQNLLGGNPINKAECGNPLLQENLYLIFETNRFVPAIGGLGSSDTFKMSCQRREAAVECFFRRGEGSFIFHGNPQVHRKWLCCEAVDFANNFAYSLRFEAMSTERSESPKVRNGRRKPLRGQASERTLNDWVLQSQT
jgi:hypothetical protein